MAPSDGLVTFNYDGSASDVESMLAALRQSAAQYALMNTAVAATGAGPASVSNA